jgi:protein-ribulosamine 3-kinase
MVEGEFNSMSAIYNIVPNFTPQPFAWGKFKIGNPDTYFFLCEFILMSPELPDPEDFCSQLAELHRNSVSPTGKFGFHITTCHGKFPQCVGWEDSWQIFYSKFLGAVLQLDVELNGEWRELQTLSLRLLNIVIPRLLGALEIGNPSLKPCLIHGDLWGGNAGTDVETGKVYIFDAAAFYAHNELEIGMWRRKKLGLNTEKYKQCYLTKFGKSEPAAEFDDRNRLYCIVFDMWHSAHHRKCKERFMYFPRPSCTSTFAKNYSRAYDDILYLVNKFAPET